MSRASSPGLSPGITITATPHDLSVTGGSVARIDGMAVFLDKGLPGETLRARITENKARFVKAEVLETLAASPHERPSFCPFGGECGGCAWTTLAYAEELAWKERQVRETLRRIGKVSFETAECLPVIPSPRDLGYRNKMEFAFGFDEESRPALGLRRRNSHAVVSVDDCPLCAIPVRAILAAARDWLRTSGLLPWDGKTGFPRFLVVRCPEYAPGGTRRCLVECITAPGNNRAAQSVAALGKTLLASGAATGFVHSERRDRANVAYGEKNVFTQGETTVTEKIGHVILEAPVRAFLQANTGAAALLYKQVDAYAGKTAGTICDLYSGVGGLALFLAAGGKIVRGIESVSEAVDFARKNAAAAGGDVAFARGDAARALDTAGPAPDLVVTDPPRAGMARELVAALLRRKPRRIITVGCDAAPLARDIALLGEAYAVRSVRAVDLFPHTPHVETAVLLALKA